MRTTTSKVVAQSHTVDERAALLFWCQKAASNGGSFSITAAHDQAQGHCITYVIEWPDSIKPPGGLCPDSAGVKEGQR